jgi:hypothetical protein
VSREDLGDRAALTAGALARTGSRRLPAMLGPRPHPPQQLLRSALVVAIRPDIAQLATVIAIVAASCRPIRSDLGERLHRRPESSEPLGRCLP